METKGQKSILIAPLNWGIGHATRCIPIINALLKNNFRPILASDGIALQFLKKEFPDLTYYELPSYNIQYSKNPFFLKLKLFFQTPKVLKTIKKEQKIVQQIIEKENIKGLISDNRFGVRSDNIPSVYITHQIKVLSGITSYFTSKFHQKIINKFDECWVPDLIEHPKLAGKLSNPKKLKINVKYLGILSRFNFNEQPKNQLKNDVLILLSGPEPQRSILENKLINTFKNSTKKIVFVRGIITEKGKKTNTKFITFKNYLLQNELKKTVQESNLIIARSGYSTIMDLAILQKKVFFIPTPGQSEQEYLAEHLQKLNIAPFCKQNSFTLSKLDEINNYSGFNNIQKRQNYICFDIFK